MDKSSNTSSESYLEPDFLLQLKKIMEEEHGPENEENDRLKKLIQEGQIETVYQILSHRKALATIKGL